MAAVDSDRYDCDREGWTVRQDDGLNERQNIIHQKLTRLSWDEKRSLRGLHGTVLFRTYLFFCFFFVIQSIDIPILIIENRYRFRLCILY